MTPLARRLRARIEADGPLSVAAFMAAAAGDPDHGYYRRSAAPDGGIIGRRGDFVTAPEISQVFGELLAAWCVGVWQAMGAPRPVLLVELGPGRATLLADLWRAAAAVAPEFTAAVHLHLVETSAALAAVQRASVQMLLPLPQVSWHESADDIPAGPVVLLANEFLDALPVEQYVREGNLWRQRHVDLAEDGARFAFCAGPPVDCRQRPDLTDLPDAAHGEIAERSPQAEALVARIAARVSGGGGAALFIDYGPARSELGETLQAVRDHRPVDPLAHPGEADLTAHVDFERLARAATAAGARSWGPLAQGLFLGRLGIAARAEALMATASSAAEADAIAGAVRRLVHPGRMGVLFKALAVCSPNLSAPPGFASR